MKICPGCGEENPEKFRLCGFCGTPLDAPARRKEVRKTVTVVFSDLKGSTSLGEALDPESLREVITRYFDAMRSALESHGGIVEKYIGDAVMAVFGLEVAHEDDAVRAVRAAHTMQSALRKLNDEVLEPTYGVRLANRTGVNTGEVLAGDPTTRQRLVTGDAVNVAARLEQAAGADEVLLGGLTRTLSRDFIHTEPVEPLELRGKAERVAAHRLLGLAAQRARPDAAQRPLVGREAELGALLDLVADVTATGGCRLATLLGDPGLGKSRLIDEVIARAPGARALRGRCLSYGRGITFWPLVEVVRDAVGAGEGDSAAAVHAAIARHVGDDGSGVADRVAAAIGLSDSEHPLEEIFWGARKLLEALASRRPLILVFEDMHWAELTFLDFVEHLRASAEGPILLLCAARRELRDIRPDWRGERIELRALDDDAAARVISDRLGGLEIAPDVRRRIVAAAHGNPLFVEQLVSMLVDEGLLRRDGQRWRGEAALADLRVPPTVGALIAARLDQLAPAERAVVDAASIMGVVFYAPAVRALLDEEAGVFDVEGHLDALVRRQLVEPAPADVVAEESYRFQHELVREAAYGALLKRATLHERFTRWLLRFGRREDLDEIVAYHLEQAHRYLAELGPLDAHGRELGARAAELLVAAGQRGFARDDMPAASNLLRRAVGLMPDADPRRIALLAPLGEAFMDIGECAVAQGYVEEAITLAGARGDERLAARAALVLLLLRGQAGAPGDWAADIAREAEAMVPALEGARDEEGLATAWRVVAWAQGTVCRYGAAAEAAQRAMEHAARAGDERQHRRAAVQYSVAATYGPVPVGEALPRVKRILDECRGDRRSEGVVMSLLARLEAMAGDVEAGRRLYRMARATLEDAGRSVVASSTSLDSCGVEMLAGDLAAAERELRRDYEALAELDERYILSTVAAELARVLCAARRDDEAWAATEVAQELAADDDLVSQALWRSTRGRLLARRGRLSEGLRMAQEALDMLEGTGPGVTQADALLDLAELLAAAGRGDEAVERVGEATSMLAAKGDVLGAAAARGRLDEGLAVGALGVGTLSASGRCAS